MKKFECNDCEATCELTIQMGEFMPRYCLYNTEKADWYEVKEDTTQVTTQVEDLESYIQLPDWVKVGEWVYDTTIKEYGCIKKDESKGWYFEHIEDGTIIQARQRPFNEKEMKALVGKVIGWENNLGLVISYNAADGDVYVDQMWCSAKYLMDNEYTIDGKPCFKLEHLNEKGEWVE